MVDLSNTTSGAGYPAPPALPAQKSLLDTVNQFQDTGLKQQQFQSNQLNLVDAGLKYLSRAIGSLGPNASKDQYLEVGQDMVKLGLVPPNTLNIYADRLAKAPTSQDFYNEIITATADHQQQVDYHLGRNQGVDIGNGVQPVVTSPKPGFGMRSTGLPIATNPPPTAQIRNEKGEPALLGQQPPVAPSGMVTAPPPGPGFTTQLPVSRPNVTPPGPITDPAIPGPSSNFGGTVTGATAEPATFASRFGPATGFAPGAKEAADIAGAASGTQLAQARQRAATFQRDIFPLAQAIPDLEKLGSKGTGPGTDTINHLKSFIISNVPGVSERDPAFASVPTYDKAKKYLTDFVNQTGNSGTNDKLAAAFAGNPSVHISNAAAVDVAKSALALRRMQQAIDLGFDHTGLPEKDFAKWAANKTSTLDARAFGVDLMSDDAKAKLRDQLMKNPKEKALFEQSLQMAHSLNFITPQQ